MFANKTIFFGTLPAANLNKCQIIYQCNNKNNLEEKERVRDMEKRNKVAVIADKGEGETQTTEKNVMIQEIQLIY